jgi:hypothetical protein
VLIAALTGVGSWLAGRAVPDQRPFGYFTHPAAGEEFELATAMLSTSACS